VGSALAVGGVKTGRGRFFTINRDGAILFFAKICRIPALTIPIIEHFLSYEQCYAQPKIGFVSLGCPKNLVDSERILTELRTEGYDVVPTYDNADMVIVNTCGFIDSAVQEVAEAIGEALKENGKVIVTGCLGAKEDQIREVHPKVLEITGPHSYEQVLEHVHHYTPKPSTTRS
jgi:hypothetical protein